MAQSARWSVLIVAAVFGSPAAYAERTMTERAPAGIGVMVGEPIGVAGKLYLANDHAVQAGLGLSWWDRGLVATVDYLWHPGLLADEEDFVMPWYIGPGLTARQHERGDEGTVGFGARGVIGALVELSDTPLDVFGEVGVGLDVDTSGGLAVRPFATLGVRYYF